MSLLLSKKHMPDAVDKVRHDVKMLCSVLC